MNISKVAKPPERVYLREIDNRFAELEGDVPEDQQVWVAIRRITERDNMLRAELNASRQIVFGASLVTEQQYNSRQRRAYEVHWTLMDAGNLTYSDDGSAVFPKMPVRMIPFSEFDMIWGGLDPVVAESIYQAIIKVNPSWSLD